HEAYVQSTVARLISAPYALRVVVVNFRGCAGVKLTSHVLYNAGATGDFALAVEHVQNRLPGAKMVAVGYSLGANLVTKYAGELGARCPLKGVVSVGNPYDLAASSDAIDEPTLRNRFVYVPAMLQGLLRLYRRHRKMIESGPVQLDTQAISRITTIRQFDDLITARLFGYRDAADYYEQNSSVHFMPDIRVPYLAITALDDPVCPEQYVPRDIFRSNPYLVLALTRFGGHLGFHESPVVSTLRAYMDSLLDDFQPSALGDRGDMRRFLDTTLVGHSPITRSHARLEPSDTLSSNVVNIVGKILNQAVTKLDPTIKFNRLKRAAEQNVLTSGYTTRTENQTNTVRGSNCLASKHVNSAVLLLDGEVWRTLHAH
ncbi:hypothetical protein LPJ73_007402, partial [Coemansia sp. RSA 2703]